MISVLVIVGLVLTCFGGVCLEVARAPFGYEDENGFHFGRQEEAIQEELPFYWPAAKPA